MSQQKIIKIKNNNEERGKDLNNVIYIVNVCKLCGETWKTDPSFGVNEAVVRSGNRFHFVMREIPYGDAFIFLTKLKKKKK